MAGVVWGLALPNSIAQQTQPPQPANVHFTIHEYESDVGVSPPLRDIGPQGKPQGNPNRPLLRPGILRSDKLVVDTALQSSAPALNAATQGSGFPGLDVGVYAVAPSDVNIAVGPNHIVQMVNVQYAVFNKLGVLQMTPLPLGAIFAGHGLCETLPTSDPIVRYDQLADRWLLSYVAFDFNNFDFHECIAVSTSPDPTSSYYLYDFDFNFRLQDYPKFGVWPDGYYMAANSYAFGFSFEGADLCAFERDKMLVGAVAKGICVLTNQFFVGQLPSDLDGSTTPPPNSPNYFVGLYTYNPGNLAMFRFVPNYVNTGATSVTGPFFIPTSAFNLPCGNGGECVPQLGTTQLLDSLGDRAMYRLAYRNFGTHESLLLNHSVGVNSTVGIRWYEIRNPNGTPIVNQEGTYAPDSDYRWMASMAMDKSGNIGVGYSKSGTTLNPGIYFTGRETGDVPLNELQQEQLIKAGGGSQTGLNRWGDYSSMEVDPTDDCTFWYTQQYLPADGSFNWATWIAPFKFSSCGGSPPPSAPAAPTNLAATAPAYNQVNLTWTDAATNEDGYRVYRCNGTACAPATLIATLGANANSHSDTSVNGSILYRYKVQPFNAAGPNDSNIAEVTTPPPPPAPPAAPTGLTAFAGASGTSRFIDLAWTDNANNETGFQIQRCNGSGCTPNTLIATVGSNVTTYRNTGLSRKRTYRYRVRAINSAGNSAYSNIASATTAK